MKKIFLGLSVAALGFLFVRDYRATATPNASEEAPVVLADDEPSDPSGKTTDVASVVQKALAFKALLNTTQQATLEQTYTATVARRWSNLPVGNAQRNGVRFDALTSAQLTAAIDVIREAHGLGTSANEAFDEFNQIRAADSLLGTIQNGYGKNLYFIAFLNTPTTTGAWMLQFGGHHYAANIAFNGGQVVGATPYHTAIEPLSFTDAGGTARTPLYQERDALIAMWSSLSTTQISGAQLSGTFGDIQLGASSSTTTNFPSPAGLACSTLTTAQKQLVLAAMRPWVTDIDTATANTLMSIYESEMDSTFIGWAGGRTYTATGNYARIDGPSVWIELATQGGVVLSGVHYHTIWRDQKRDYGKELTATSLGTPSTGVNDAAEIVAVTAYPNPATDRVHIIFPTNLTSANVQVANVANGQTVQMLMGRRGPVVELNTERLALGYYVVRINDEGKEYVGKFSKR